MGYSLISVDNKYHVIIKEMAQERNISMAKLIYGFVDRALLEGDITKNDSLPALITEQERLYRRPVDMLNPVPSRAYQTYTAISEGGVTDKGLTVPEARKWVVATHSTLRSISVISGNKKMRIKKEIMPLLVDLIGLDIMVQEKEKDRFYPLNNNAKNILDAVGKNSHNQKQRFYYSPDDLFVLWIGAWKIIYNNGEENAA